jgi:hypothetical protein
VIPSSHLLDRHAQPIGLRSMDGFDLDVQFPNEPEHSGEAFDAVHLLGDQQSGVVVYRMEGQDVYEFVCKRHQLSRGPVSDLENVIARCPVCETEAEAERLRVHYRVLHLRLTVGAR